MTRMSVGFAPELGDLALGLIASFPRSLELVEGLENLGVMLLSGRAGWSAKASDLIASGIRRVLVIDPGRDAPEDIRALSQHCAASGASVVLSESYADNPAIYSFARWQEFGRDLLTLHGVGAVEVPALFLMQLRLLRALGFVEPSLDDVVVMAGSLLVSGKATLAGKVRDIRLMATQTRVPATMELRMHDSTSTVRLDLFDARSARPAVAALTTDEGLTMLPTIYESSHRARLRQMCNGEGGSCHAALEQFVSDMELSEVALG